MEPGDLMEGTGQKAMHEPARPADSTGGGDGASVIGSKPPGGSAGGGIGKMLMAAVLLRSHILLAVISV
eukprot:COSAG03_NODE_3269_length_2116_cov_2.499256_3_plen_69_part_00